MIKIRHAKMKDAARISRFVTELARKHIGPVLAEGAIEFLVATMDEPSTFTRIMDEWPTYCAEDGDELCGIAVVKPPCHLYHLFVRSDLQGQGIGRALFQTADEEVVKRHGAGIQTVNSSLNVVAIYEQLGFEIAGPAEDLRGVRWQPMNRVSQS